MKIERLKQAFMLQRNGATNIEEINSVNIDTLSYITDLIKQSAFQGVTMSYLTNNKRGRLSKDVVEFSLYCLIESGLVITQTDSYYHNSILVHKLAVNTTVGVYDISKIPFIKTPQQTDIERTYFYNLSDVYDRLEDLNTNLPKLKMSKKNKLSFGDDLIKSTSIHDFIRVLNTIHDKDGGINQKQMVNQLNISPNRLSFILAQLRSYDLVYKYNNKYKTTYIDCVLPYNDSLINKDDLYVYVSDVSTKTEGWNYLSNDIKNVILQDDDVKVAKRLLKKRLNTVVDNNNELRLDLTKFNHNDVFNIVVSRIALTNKPLTVDRVNKYSDNDLTRFIKQSFTSLLFNLNS